MFEFGADFQWGYAVYIDGVLALSLKQDIYWRNNWNSKDVISIDRDFDIGSHTITIYGMSGKNRDREMDFRFQKNK